MLAQLDLSKFKFEDQGTRGPKFTVRGWKSARYGVTYVFLVVCRVLCVKLVGSTSSEGFLAFTVLFVTLAPLRPPAPFTRCRRKACGLSASILDTYIYRVFTVFFLQYIDWNAYAISTPTTKHQHKTPSIYKRSCLLLKVRTYWSTSNSYQGLSWHLGAVSQRPQDRNLLSEKSTINIAIIKYTLKVTVEVRYSFCHATLLQSAVF